MAEVQIIDENGYNVAIGKPTKQSSTTLDSTSDKSVDGNTGDWKK